VTLLAPRVLRRVKPREAVVGVMGARVVAGDVPPWMREFMRHALNTTLQDVAGVAVFSQEKIDFLCESRGLCGIAGAEALGMTRMITPSLSAAGDRIALQVEVIDVAGNGLLEFTERVQGPGTQFIELQNALHLRLLERLGVGPTREDRARLLSERTNDMLESYRMLVETLGGKTQGGSPPPAAGSSSLFRRWSWVRDASAAEPTESDETAIRRALESYAAALSARDVEAVARLQVSMSPGQRAAIERYFGHATDLHVTFSSIDVLRNGDEALASYVREDRFNDARSGRTIQLKVQLSTRLRKDADGWKLELPE